MFQCVGFTQVAVTTTLRSRRWQRSGKSRWGSALSRTPIAEHRSHLLQGQLAVGVDDFGESSQVPNLAAVQLGLGQLFQGALREGQAGGLETRITLIDVNGSSPKVLLDSPHRYAAPEWTPDGAGLIINSGGKLWHLPTSGGTPTPIPAGSATWIDINHAVSPDSKSLAFTAGPIWKIPTAGGEPVSITASSGNYVHAWSPDGKRLAFSSNRGKGLDLFSMSADGGSERQLTTSPRADDAPQYSPDGRWIYR